MREICGIARVETAALLLLMGFIASFSGCERPGAAPAATTPQPTDPAAQFEEIVKRIKWDIQGGLDTPNFRSFVYPSATVFIEESVQDSQLIPPDEDHDSFRGSITIASSVEYSARKQIEQPEPARAQKKGLIDDFSASDDEDELEASVFQKDPLFSDTNQSDSSAQPTRVTEIVGRHEDTDIQVYEFIYRDDAWELATEIDEENNSGMKRTIEHALSMQ